MMERWETRIWGWALSSIKHSVPSHRIINTRINTGPSSDCDPDDDVEHTKTAGPAPQLSMGKLWADNIFLSGASHVIEGWMGGLGDMCLLMSDIFDNRPTKPFQAQLSWIATVRRLYAADVLQELMREVFSKQSGYFWTTARKCY